MSQLLVDDIVNKDDSGAFSASKGINVSGITTLGFTTFSGDTWTLGVSTVFGRLHSLGNFDVTGDVDINATDDSTSLATGSLVVQGGVAIAKNVNVGAGISVVGIATIGAGVTISVAGIHASSGIVTASAFEGDGAGLTGLNIPSSFTELDAALFN